MAGSAAVAPRAAPRNRRRLSWLGPGLSTSAMTSSCAGISGMEGIRWLLGTIRKRGSGVNVTWLALTARTGLPRLPRMARIAIDLARRIGSVDRRIFGNFIEHLGRCIYGGIFEEGSPLSDARGFRQAVLEAARPLRVPILRWPGGNFVSGYHWLDGVGPGDARPRRSDLAWYAEESNRFGTNEFIEYCRALDTEAYISL